MRSTIALLLLIPIAASGCDRQSTTPPQDNAAQAAAAPAVTANEGEAVVVEEKIGTLDRSHRGEALPPEYGFTTLDGTARTLADFRGRPVLVNLWATWCAPCVAEMPTLDRLAGDLAGKVQVVAISQDLEGAQAVAPFWQKNGYARLTPYLDTAVRWSTGLGVNLPTTILYDSQGREVWRMLGGMDWTGETARALIAEAR